MNQYQTLSNRYYKFFKYSRTIAIISLTVYLIVTAINTNNPTLDTISYFLLILTMATALETGILYVLYTVTKNRK